MSRLDRSSLRFAFIALLAVLLQVFSFHSYHLSHDIGLDESVRWIFNQGLDIGENIIFTYGPFLPLHKPILGNLLPALLFQFGIKFLLFYLLFRLKPEQSFYKRTFLSFTLAFFIAYYANALQWILMAILLALLNYHSHFRKWDIYLAQLLACIAFYISTYTASIAIFMLTSSFIWSSMTNKNKWSVTLLYRVFPLLLLLVWLILGRPVNLLLDYAVGQFNLIQDNSSAAAYYPANNWWYLGAFLVLVVVLIISNVFQRKARLYFALTALFLFASWKHGMAREDSLHAKLFINNFILMVLLGLYYIRKYRWQNGFIALLAVFFFNLNLKNVYYPTQLSVDNKLANFYTFFSELKSIKEEAKKETEKNLKKSVLPTSILHEIKEHTVDIYPWYYTQVPANGLNWKPRPIVQSYASYTATLDHMNAKHFREGKGADFLIWKFDSSMQTPYGGTYQSIDFRHLLNDEPQTLLELMSNYERVKQTETYYLYRKRSSSLQFQSELQPLETGYLNMWIQLPKYDAQVLRLKLFLNRSWLQVLKSLLYKDEQFWIQYRMKNGAIHQYRIVPKSAQQGLWLEPYLTLGRHSQNIEAVRILGSNSKLLRHEFSYQFETIDFEESDRVDDFINQSSAIEEPALFRQRLIIRPNQEFEFLDNYFLHSSEAAYVIPSNGYSPIMEAEIQDSSSRAFTILANFKITFPTSRERGRTVLAIEYWQNGLQMGKELVYPDHELLDLETPVWVSLGKQFKHDQKATKVKVYLWNFAEHSVSLHDARLFIDKTS